MKKVVQQSGSTEVPSVKRIRKLFANNTCKDKSSEEDLQGQNSQDILTTRRLNESTVKKLKGKAEQVAARRHGPITPRPNKHSIKEATGVIECKNSCECHNHRQSSTSNYRMQDQRLPKKYKKMDAEAVTDKTVGEQLITPEEGNNSEQEMEANEELNPQVYAAATVNIMFQKIQEEMKVMREEFKKHTGQVSEKITQKVIDKNKEAIVDKVSQVVSMQMEKNEQDTQKLRKELTHFKFRNRTLTNVAENLNTEIDDLKARLDNLELNSFKTAVSMSGLDISEIKVMVWWNWRCLSETTLT